MNKGTNSSKASISLKKGIMRHYEKKAEAEKMPLSKYLRLYLTKIAEAEEEAGELSAIEAIIAAADKFAEWANEADYMAESLAKGIAEGKSGEEADLWKRRGEARAYKEAAHELSKWLLLFKLKDNAKKAKKGKKENDLHDKH